MKFFAKAAIFCCVLSLMVIGLCACGNDGEQEETVEITTVEEGAQTPENEDVSIYEELYNEYSSKLEDASEGYLKELKEKAGDLSKDAMYDETVNMQDKLKDVYEEGTKAMTDATLDSTEDDTDTYQKYLKKLEKKYSDLSRELTGPYQERF